MRCPGQDPRYWKEDAIFDVKCPNCGHSQEFFKDETRRRCPKCGYRVLNPKMDFGCAAHCKFAEQCFGELPPELIQEKKNLFKDRVAVEVKLHYKQDFKRIARAAKVARHAEKIAKAEEGDPAVVLSAAYLYEVDRGEADNQAQASTPDSQSRDHDTENAREILTKLDASAEMTEEVCDILARIHSPRADETANFKSVYDAGIIVDLEQQKKASASSADELGRLIDTRLLTAAGKELARSVLLNGTNGKDAGSA